MRVDFRIERDIVACWSLGLAVRYGSLGSDYGDPRQKMMLALEFGLVKTFVVTFYWKRAR